MSQSMTHDCEWLHSSPYQHTPLRRTLIELCKQHSLGRAESSAWCHLDFFSETMSNAFFACTAAAIFLGGSTRCKKSDVGSNPTLKIRSFAPAIGITRHDRILGVKDCPFVPLPLQLHTVSRKAD